MTDKKATKIDQDLEGLNPAQYKAVTHSGRPLLIVAGAGTGKTYAISRRVAWLINSGQCRPEEILALTFTDKASQEMVDRIEARLPLGYPDLWVSTFHSFCQRILKEHGLDVGLPNDFRLLNETDAYLLIRHNFDRFALDYYRPLGNPNKFVRAMLKHFSRAKDEAITPEDYLEFVRNSEIDPEDRSRLGELAGAYGTYQQLLRDNDSLDIGDLITCTIGLFRSRPKLLKKYRDQFKEIIVDEFQDTNWAQYELLKLLAADGGGKITVVGDDDQSIYKFRGASISNILKFKEDFPDAEEVVLTDNYRSRQEILDSAYGFIQQNNPNRLEAKLSLSKRLTAAREGSAEIAHLRFVDGESEAAGVVDKIIELKHDEPDSTWSDFCILVRSNASADPFSQELRRRGIPFQFLALRGLYGKPIILDVMSYFRLLDDYHESPAMFRTLSSPPYRIDGNDLIEIVHQAKRQAKSVFEIVSRHSELGSLQAETHGTIDRLLGHLERHTKMSKERSVSELYISYLYDSGYAVELKREESAEDRENASYANQFLNRLRRFENASDTGHLREFMEEFNLELESGESGGLDFDPETGPDMVRVMTVHAAKGLEYPTVFIGQMADKRFPSVERGGDIPLPDGLAKEMIPEGDVHLQEERRLFYVAMTRAKDRLYFSSSEDYGGKTKRKPSRFLADLGFDDVSPSASSIMLLRPSVPAEPEPLPEPRMPKSFSFTQLAAYASCPLQYKYAHILRLPVFGKPAFSFGRTMHLTLEKFMDEFRQRTEIPFSEMLEMYSENWQDDWYTGAEEKEAYRLKGEQILEKFHKATLANPPKVHSLEQDFMLKIAGVSVKGKIDRIDQLDDGTVELIDYKTGKPKDRSGLDTDSKRQLLLYQLAAERVLELKPSKLTFHYLEDGSRLEFLGKEKEIERLEDHVGEIVAKISDGQFSPTPGWQCQYCDFKEICEFKDN